MQSRLKLALIFIAFCAISAGASAHIGVDDLAHLSFFTGCLHPLSGLDHLAAMVSVGVWSALTARRESYELLWGPVGFAYMLLVGAVLGLQGVSLAAGEPMIACWWCPGCGFQESGLLFWWVYLPSSTAWPMAMSWQAALTPPKPWSAC
jgi:hydrogenase/urease accessory protein HupE